MGKIIVKQLKEDENGYIDTKNPLEYFIHYYIPDYPIEDKHQFIEDLQKAVDYIQTKK